MLPLSVPADRAPAEASTPAASDNESGTELPLDPDADRAAAASVQGATTGNASSPTTARDPTGLITCVNCGFQDQGIFCSNCGCELGKSSRRSIKSFLHDITPLPIMVTFWRILIRRKEFFQEVAAGNFANKSRAEPYAVATLSLMFLVSSLSGEDMFEPRWSSAARELSDQQRTAVIYAISELAWQDGWDSSENIIAALSSDDTEAHAEYVESMFDQVFGSHKLEDIAFKLSRAGYRDEGGDLFVAHKDAVQFSSYVKAAMPFIFLLWIMMQAFSQHFFINYNGVKFALTVQIFCYFYGSLVLCFTGVLLVTVSVNLASQAELPAIGWLQEYGVVPVVVVGGILTLFFYRTVKEIVGAGYMRQIAVSWFVAPVAGILIVTAGVMVVAIVVWPFSYVFGLGW